MSLKLRNFYEIGREVNTDPRIVVFEDFLRAQEIELLIELAKPQLQPALVSDVDSGVPSQRRSGSNCWVAHAIQPLVAELALRISDVVGIPLEFAESLQVVHYDEGEEYAPHYDAWDAATERGQRCMLKGGQRLVTCLLYLNTPAEGGATSFPNLDMAVEAIKGRMVLFHNCYEGSVVRHPDTLHGGMPVLEGEKWACNLWFREKSYQAPESVPVRKVAADSQPKFKRVI